MPLKLSGSFQADAAGREALQGAVQDGLVAMTKVLSTLWSSNTSRRLALNPGVQRQRDSMLAGRRTNALASDRSINKALTRLKLDELVIIQGVDMQPYVRRGIARAARDPALRRIAREHQRGPRLTAGQQRHLQQVFLETMERSARQKLKL